MPHRLTAVPAAAVPPLGRVASTLLPLADGFMLVLWSRPASGSLRRTWVTPATLLLVVPLMPLLVTASVLLFGANERGGHPLLLLAFALCLLGAAGCGSVAVVGLDQRRARGR